MYRITPIVAATEAVAVFGILISTTLNVKHPHAVDKGSKGTKNPNTNLERKNRVDGVAAVLIRDNMTEYRVRFECGVLGSEYSNRNSKGSASSSTAAIQFLFP